MIDRNILDQLADAVSRRGGALPAVKCQSFYEMMSELFTAEEAVLATKLPLEAMTAGQLSQIEGLGDDVRLKNMLESMADRGLVLAEKGGDNTAYRLLPLLPGMMEFQFLKGGMGERDRKVILLIHEYLRSVNQAYAATRQAAETDAASGKKRITLDALVAHIAVVHSYSQVLELIEKTEHIAAGTCLCRHRGEMLDRPCDKPKDVCMIFGPEAKAAADRGLVRMLSKAEARAVLDRAEEAGLVHQSMYQQGGFVDFLCNCCSCHCGTLRGIKRSPAPSLAAMVRQVINIDKASCIGCGLCMHVCAVDALKLVVRAHPWDTIPVS